MTMNSSRLELTFLLSRLYAYVTSANPDEQLNRVDDTVSFASGFSWLQAFDAVEAKTNIAIIKRI